MFQIFVIEMCLCLKRSLFFQKCIIIISVYITVLYCKSNEVTESTTNSFPPTEIPTIMNKSWSIYGVEMSSISCGSPITNAASCACVYKYGISCKGGAQPLVSGSAIRGPSSLGTRETSGCDFRLALGSFLSR